MLERIAKIKPTIQLDKLSYDKNVFKWIDKQ